MRTDIAIVGGGLAGSAAAALLGRVGHDVHLIEPHDGHPAEFRCEKLERPQLETLGRTGLLGPVLAAGDRIDTIWIARYGHVVDKMPLQQCAMPYEALVDALRSQIPSRVPVTRSWADRIEASADRQRVTTADGRQVDARLVVLACGLHWRLRASLGIGRRLVSACHSVTLGFDLRRRDGAAFAFPAMQYFPDRIGRGVAYLTLFGMGGRMRANLFVYRDLKDPLLRGFRTDPDAALRALLPKLSRLIGDYEVRGPLKVRPTDLHALDGVERPGVVLVGDAFATPCPVTGTGTVKALNDVEILCAGHVPGWLSSPGMGVHKIREFYRDAAKVGVDAKSARLAFEARSLALDEGFAWRSRRVLRLANRLVRWAARARAGRLPAAGG